MPNHFNKIETIKVGTTDDHARGVISSDGIDFAIYSSNYQQNYSSEPSSFKLNVVAEDSLMVMSNYLGRQSIQKGNLEKISVVSDKGSILFDFLGFLVGHSESVSAGTKTYTLDFLDESIILDKYYVGLTNRMMESTQNANGYLELRVSCMDCSTGQNRDPESRRVYFSSQQGKAPELMLKTASYVSYTHAGDVYQGGLIIVGTEQVNESACQIKEVDYTFKDLVDTLRINKLVKVTGIPLDDVLRRAHTGTLREVLSNWLVDFGYSFFWDSRPTTGSYLAIGHVTCFSTATGFSGVSSYKGVFMRHGIESMEYTSTLQGATSTGFVSRLLKPASAKNDTFTKHIPVDTSPFTLDDALKFFSGVGGSPRKQDTAAGLLTSVALAKYNTDIRTLYYLAGSQVGLAARGNTFALEALGIYVLDGASFNAFGNLASEARRDTFDVAKAYHQESYFQIIKDWGADNTVFVPVYFSQDIESKFVAWEKEIADNFVGKFFKVDKYAKIHKPVCGTNWLRTTLANSDPEILDFYPADEINTDAYGTYRDGGTLPSYFIDRGKAPWGISGDTGSVGAFGAIKRYLPRFLPMQSDAKEGMETYPLVNHLAALDEGFEIEGARFNLGIMAFYKPTLSDRNFSVVNLAGGINPLEVPWKSSSAETDSCVPDCSETLIDALCGPECSKRNASLSPGPDNQRARVTKFEWGGVGDVSSGSAIIYYPFGAIDLLDKFKRIESIDISNTGFKKSLVKIALTHPGGTTKSLSVDMVENDITNQLMYYDQLSGGSTIIKDTIAVIGPNGARLFSTLGEYHDAVTLTSGKTWGERETLSVTIPSSILESGSLSSILNPWNGLNSINFGLGANGSTLSLRFSTLPEKKPSKDVVMRKIQPLVRTYGRG